MKFQYGVSDFKKINTQGYFYCDKTDKINPQITLNTHKIWKMLFGGQCPPYDAIAFA